MSKNALSLHPVNPHYFLFRGKPTVLITSGEHYAAVLNPDFDYRKYLDTLQGDGFNHTRLFVGVYRERPEEHWPKNPLGPVPDRFLCPFGRSAQPGSADGGNKFDLDTWDEAFFVRLRDFCQRADDRGIVIEINLFCPHYAFHANGVLWNLSPFHAGNNVNGLGEIPSDEVYTLKHKALQKYQDAMARKIIQEVGGHDNLYFEICNEPYCDKVSMEWQHHIAELIQAEEKGKPLQYLVSWNVANEFALVTEVHPAISILNFHYPRPTPRCVTENFNLGRLIGCNETGFDGATAEPYRIQAWQFMLAGGGLFNHLDAAFCVGDEGGARDMTGANFGGGPEIRKQLRLLKDFMESFDFVRMAPAPAALADAGGAAAYLLAEPGKQYALYLRRGETPPGPVTLNVPDGQYTLQWIDPCKGPRGSVEKLTAVKGKLTLRPGEYRPDVAARILKAS
ncbi:MAG: cellulase family glycosylhydrolase [Planctomycetota bacterium]